MHTPDHSQALSRVFTTAILLTGSVEQAEAAVLDGIDTWDPGETLGEGLLLEVMAAAIAPSVEAGQQPKDRECASAMLPSELRPVLGLPLDLRKCFVLRVLMSTPRESCVRLLELNSNELDQNTCLAAEALAQAAKDTRRRT